MSKIIKFLGILFLGFFIFKKFQEEKQASENKSTIQNYVNGNKIVKKVKKDSEIKNLNDRQNKIVKMFNSKDSIKLSDAILLINNVNERTIRRDFAKLEELNIIEQRGKTRDSNYVLKHINS